MSIPLREGFVDETLERCLEDLLVRFVLNCPEEDLSSIERVLFQIEEAHWFYQDFLRTLNPLLPSMKMKLFTNKLIEQCPLVWKWGDPSEALSQFGKYKSTIPVRGCALLNPSMTKILLVKGIESPSWGFPRGKISKDESDVDCALRELDEETGFDASNLIQEDVFVERTIKGKNYKIFIIKGVPEDYNFAPKVRYEISEIRWMDIKYLTKAIKTTNNFYLVGSMIKSIVAYINGVKKGEDEDELKKLATAQLKKILGINSSSSPENETSDPGRELLALLKSVGQSGGANASTITNSLNSSPHEQSEQAQHTSSTGPPLHQELPPQHPSNVFLPPHLLAYQHNRMIPINHHTPFPLQMFNPYHSFPSYGFNQISPATLNNGLFSQEMSAAPSVSTLPKPQFVQRPNPQNARELLNVLKKPTPNETKKTDSAELLNILKKDDKKPTSPTSSASSTLISILKRQPNSEKREVSGDTRVKERKRDKELIDITEPANGSTSRDITSSISDDKPVVLLRKGSQRNQAKADASPSPLSQSATHSSTATMKFQNETNSNFKNEGQLLNEPSKFEESNASTQLLNILQRNKPVSSSTPLSLHSTPAVDPTQNESSPRMLNTPGTLFDNPSGPKLLTHESNSVASDTSKYLLDIVQNKHEQTSKLNNDPSAHLLHILKTPGNEYATNNSKKVFNEPSDDPSAFLLKTLKSQPLNSQQYPNDPSKNLLDILKNPQSSDAISSSSAIKPESNPNTMLHEPSKPLSQQSGQPQALSNDLSSELLSVLKRPQSLSNQETQAMSHKENGESNVLPSNFVNVLKGQDIPPTSAIESFQDFDEWDGEASDGYEDAAEYVNDVLYD